HELPARLRLAAGEVRAGLYLPWLCKIERQTGQPTQSGQGQLLEGDQAGDGVARQHEDAARADTPPGERLARLDGQAPLNQFTLFRERRLQVIFLADRHTARADDRVGHLCGTL